VPATLPNGIFALETTTTLLDQQIEFIAKWVQLRRQMVDNCPGCPGPPVDVVNSVLEATNQALRSASDAARQIVAYEAATDARSAIA
jgi:hypothetical protein